MTDLSAPAPNPVEASPIATPVAAPADYSAGKLRIWLRDIIISVVVSYFIITFLYQPVKVEGTSMAPWLHDQDRLVINKFEYDFEKIKRNDVVVFYYPRDTRLSYIKRVIALPGDTIYIDDGQVFVNGKPIVEPYVPENYRDVSSMGPLLVPEGEYFVMGDHRSISSDSRDFGPVDRELIYGKAAFVYWPMEQVGVVR